MTKACALVSLLIFVSIAGLSQTGMAPLEGGTFALEVDGRIIGQERFSIQRRADGTLGWVSHAWVRGDGAVHSFVQTLWLDADGRPLNFRQQTSDRDGERLSEAALDGAGATVSLEAGGTPQTASYASALPFDVLDDSAPSLLRFPVAALLDSGGTERRFEALYPAAPIAREARLAPAGRTTLRAGERQVMVEVYRLTEAGQAAPLILFWGEGCLLAGRRGGVRFYRQDLFPDGFALD